MNIDKIDIRIVKKLSEYDEDEEITTTQLAKDVANPDSREELINYNSLFTSKLQKLVNYGIISTEEMDNGKAKFYIDEDDVACKDASLELENNGGNSLTLESDDTILLPKDEGIYAIMFVEERE